MAGHKDTLIRTIRHNSMIYVDDRREFKSDDVESVGPAFKMVEERMPSIESWSKRKGRRGPKPIIEVWMLVASSEEK